MQKTTNATHTHIYMSSMMETMYDSGFYPHTSQIRSKSGNTGSGPMFSVAAAVVVCASKDVTVALLCAELHDAKRIMSAKY